MHSSGFDVNAHHVDSAHHTSDAARIALAALLHVRIPLLVLSNRKTVLLANHAAEQLLGLETPNGKTLSQLGIQRAQEDLPTRYTWEVYAPRDFICGPALIER